MTKTQILLIAELNVTINTELTVNREYYEESTTYDQIVARIINESELINDFSFEAILGYVLPQGGV